MGLAGSLSARGPLRARCGHLTGAAVVALVGIAIVLGALAAPSRAASREFFGIAPGAQPMDGRDFSKMEASGIGSFRFGVNWAAVQPSPGGPFLWGGVDAKVSAAAAHGLRPFPTIISSPGWVRKKSNQPPVGSKAKVNAWRAFLKELAQRYGPGGSFWTAHPTLNAKPIKDWQIWNEPNLRKFFASKHAIRDYATVVKAAHTAIGGVDPHAKIVLAGLSSAGKPAAAAFLDRLYRVRGMKSSFDAAALHPYAPSIRTFREEILKMRHAMSKHHDRRAGLWLTEVGWGSDRPTRSRPLNKGIKGQKRMLQRSFKLALHNRKRWHIQALYWFDFRDPKKGTGGCTFCDSAGLLKHNRHPKPAFKAYKRLAKSR
jgi:polysaccharide biosynthesis protein PslG